jgi:hypothetical protein
MLTIDNSHRTLPAARLGPDDLPGAETATEDAATRVVAGDADAALGGSDEGLMAAAEPMGTPTGSQRQISIDELNRFSQILPVDADEHV